MIKKPNPHRAGITPPKLAKELIPNHVAIVMDGNGRWAKERGLPRTAGHEAGEAHHHHLVCKSCGDTVEIEGGAVEKWAKMMAQEHGFREIGHTAEIFGTCSKC